jgi:hypothetical protein
VVAVLRAQLEPVDLAQTGGDRQRLVPKDGPALERMEEDALEQLAERDVQVLGERLRNLDEPRLEPDPGLHARNWYHGTNVPIETIVGRSKVPPVAAHALAGVRAARVVEPRSGSPIALGVYALLAFLYFGLGPVIEGGHQYVGVFDDPQIPIWSFAWWFHALVHGENPFVTPDVWAPAGLNLAWVNTVPALSVVFAPLTAILGPVGAYDVAAVLLPALGAWTAFLLCRHLTGQFWPSLLGGYLFGFSSYELGHMLGQPQLTAVFALPLIALVVVEGLEGSLSGGALTLRLALLMALQIYLSSELALTGTISLACGLALGFLLAPRARPRLRRLAGPVTLGYAGAAVLAAPVLYYSLTDLRVSGFTPPEAYTADLLNLVLPTHLEAVGAGWADAVARHFPGNSTEQGSFVGVPLLAIVGLYARRTWRTPRGRFLVAALALVTYLSLGPELSVGGHRVLPLPNVLGHQTISIGGHTKFLPLLDNILPVRFALYAALATAVIAALWSATARPGLLRWLLPGLTVLLLVPNPGAGVWSTSYSVPPLFTQAKYRPCLATPGNVLPQPIGMGGQAMLWQAAADFRFRMAGGRLQTSPPSPFLHPPGIAQIAVGYPPVPRQAALVRRYARAKNVTLAIVDRRWAGTWSPSLAKLASAEDAGGVLLYRLDGRPRDGCNTPR